MLEEREKDVFKNDCRFEIEQQMDGGGHLLGGRMLEEEEEWEKVRS